MRLARNDIDAAIQRQGWDADVAAMTGETPDAGGLKPSSKRGKRLPSAG